MKSIFFSMPHFGPSFSEDYGESAFCKQPTCFVVDSLVTTINKGTAAMSLQHLLPILFFVVVVLVFHTVLGRDGGQCHDPHGRTIPRRETSLERQGDVRKVWCCKRFKMHNACFDQLQLCASPKQPSTCQSRLHAWSFPDLR